MWIQAILAVGAVLAAWGHPTSSAEIGNASAIWTADEELTTAADPIVEAPPLFRLPKPARSSGRFATAMAVVVSIATIAFVLLKCMRLIQSDNSSAFRGGKMRFLAEGSSYSCDADGSQGGRGAASHPSESPDNELLQVLKLSYADAQCLTQPEKDSIERAKETIRSWMDTLSSLEEEVASLTKDLNRLTKSAPKGQIPASQPRVSKKKRQLLEKQDEIKEYREKLERVKWSADCAGYSLLLRARRASGERRLTRPAAHALTVYHRIISQEELIQRDPGDREQIGLFLDELLHAARACTTDLNSSTSPSGARIREGSGMLDEIFYLQEELEALGIAEDFTAQLKDLKQARNTLDLAVIDALFRMGIQTLSLR